MSHESTTPPQAPGQCAGFRTGSGDGQQVFAGLVVETEGST